MKRKKGKTGQKLMKKMKIIEKLNMIKQKYKIDFKVKKKSEN